MEEETPWPSATDIRPCLAGATIYEPSHEEYWTQITLKEAVTRGENLRAHKVSAPRREKEYKVIGLQSIKRPLLRKRSSQICRYASTNPNYKSVSPKNKQKSLGTCDFTNCKRYKKSMACSMRIEELAVPSKRQCLDTWRENYKTLPGGMINRLREYVLDQRATVNVDNAIRCFRNKKKKKKRPANQSTNSSSHHRRIKTVTEMDKIKSIAQMFACKMCNQLIVPLKIRLNPEQHSIAQIVARDIKKLMRSRRKECQYCNLGYKKILWEVSNTVTVWIATILEESSNRLLQEALRDLEEEEGPVLDILDSIMDVIGKSEDYFVTPSESSTDRDHKDEGEDLEPVLVDTDQIVEETAGFQEQTVLREIGLLPLEVEENQATVEVDTETDGTLLGDLAQGIVKHEDLSDKDETENDEHIEESTKIKSKKYTDGNELEKSKDNTSSEISAESENKQDKSNDIVKESDVSEIVHVDHQEKSEHTSLNDKLMVEDQIEYENQMASDKSYRTELVDEKKSYDTEASEHLQRGENIGEYGQETFKDKEASEKYSAPDLPVEAEQEKFEDLEGSENFPNAALALAERQDERKNDNLIVDESLPGKERKQTEDTEISEKKEVITDEEHSRVSSLGNEQFLDADDTVPSEKEEERKVTFDASGADLLTESKTKHKLNKDNLNPPNDHILSSADESWPDDLVLRSDHNTLDAVNKSVTSLGNIKEVSDKVQQTKVDSAVDVSKDTKEDYDDAPEVDQPKYDMTSSQTELTRKEQAQETEFQSTPPAPIIPFNKSTETEEEKFTETKDNDGSNDVESENRSEQTTHELNDKTLSIAEEQESVLQEVIEQQFSMAVNYEVVGVKQNENLETEILAQAIEEQKLVDKTSSVFMEITEKEPDTVISSHLADAKSQQSENEPTAEAENPTTIITDDMIQSDKAIELEAKAIMEVRQVKSAETLNSQKFPPETNIQQESIAIKDQVHKSEENLGSEFVGQDRTQQKRASDLSAGLSHAEPTGVVKSMPLTPLTHIDNAIVRRSQEYLENNNMARELVTNVNNESFEKQQTESQVSDQQNLKVTDKLSDAKANAIATEDKKSDVDVTVIKHTGKPKLTATAQEQNKSKKKFRKEQTVKGRDEATSKHKTEKPDYKVTKETVKETVGKKPAKKSDTNAIKSTSKEESINNAKKLGSWTKTTAPTKTIHYPAVRAKPTKTVTKKVNEPPKSQPITSKKGQEISAEEVISVTKETPSKFDFKVYLETAPSWVLNQGKGEPSEDTLLAQIKERQRLKERKLRQWCHDLEVTAINMEKWSHWIDGATANIMYLKRHENCTRISSNLDESKIQNEKWLELKTCIDKDTTLWSKLCRRATRKLDRYNSILEDKINHLELKDLCPCRR